MDSLITTNQVLWAPPTTAGVNYLDGQLTPERLSPEIALARLIT